MSRHASRPAIQSQFSREDSRRKRRWALMGVIVVLGVATIAFIDGGEEPMRPIVQEISLPASKEAAR
jgi:hypothetical protein